ncbi:MAG: DUF6361 family protein [Thermoguttaceae bacterium]
MPSRFRWVDFADDDRERMLRVVDLFREQGTQDELGIGTIRDAFADWFFPGTSTIQTRARYFLFIPWIYQRLEWDGVPSAEVAAKARRAEIKLIDALLEAGERQGVIGQEAREGLQRLPSSVYWSGLGSWGIRQFPGSQSQYHRSLDAYYRRESRTVMTDDKEPVGGGVRANWHAGLPEAPDDLLEESTMSLTDEEAEYLQANVVMCHPESLLAKLLLHDRHFECDFVWQHPHLDALPEGLRVTIQHARNFSETLHGSALLYNLLMSRARGVEEWAHGYEERLGTWAALVQGRWEDLCQWHADIRALWSLPALVAATIPYRTRVFVDQWLEILFSEAAEGTIVSPAAKRLIVEREEQLKHTRARLSNKRALELWNGASGDRQLDFRWGNVSTLLDDIHAGLGHGEDDA